MSLVRSTLETPDSGLNREQFALALRLVAAAQASHTLQDFEMLSQDRQSACQSARECWTAKFPARDSVVQSATLLCCMQAARLQYSSFCQPALQ